MDAAMVSSVSSPRRGSGGRRRTWRSGAKREDDDEVRDAEREMTTRSVAQERDMATRLAAQERGTATSSPASLHQVSLATNRVSSPEWVYLLALVLSSLIPLRPFLPCLCRNPTCPRRFFTSFGFSPSSSALGSVAGELQARSDLGNGGAGLQQIAEIVIFSAGLLATLAEMRRDTIATCFL
uniref:Uncharacterized protein n=1 Tax=Oryza glaberrima TaxID=4538 RepID=I1PVL0_ORYGL